MQRLLTYRTEQWCDKTMSVLREQQLEACQDRLSRCLRQGIFADLDEGEYAVVWRSSFYAMEHGLLPERDALRNQVLAYVPQECCYLSEREDELVKRMLMNNGETALTDWDEISAAEALIARLWCTILIDDEDMATLRLQEPLVEPILSAMMSARYAQARQRLFSFDAMLHGLLYLSGFLHADVPAAHFMQEQGQDEPNCTLFLKRYLRASFDYTQGHDGEMLLVHPGLAEPEHLISGLQGLVVPQMHLTQAMMLGGMNGILPEETAASEAMRGALHGALRPDCDVEETLGDLRMMAKQGAAFLEMRDVLESALCVLPTPSILSALEQLHLQTVRWVGMASAVLN